MKRLVVLAIVLALAGSAAGQGLSVWTPWTGRSLDVLREDAAAFERAFGVPVDVVAMDGIEIERRMLVAAAAEGESAPDVARSVADVLAGVPHDRAANLSARGLLEELGGYATASFLADLGERARLAFSFDGRLMGLPMFVEGPALLYNRTLMAEPPEDYEAFLATAVALTGDGRQGFLFDIGNFYFNYAWLRTFGGYVFGRDGGALDASDVGLATPGAVAGAEALRALRFDLGLVPEGSDYDTSHRAFLRGTAASLYTGPWAVRAARESGIDVGVAPMPPLPDGTVWSGFMQVEGVLVTTFAARRTDAVNLAKWLSRSEAQVLYARADGRIPSSQEALTRVGDEVVAGFGRALLASEPIPDLPAMGRVWGAMDDAVRTLLADESADAQRVLDEAARIVLGR